jgi:hypothetical protein
MVAGEVTGSSFRSDWTDLRPRWWKNLGRERTNEKLSTERYHKYEGTNWCRCKPFGDQGCLVRLRKKQGNHSNFVPRGPNQKLIWLASYYNNPTRTEAQEKNNVKLDMMGP